MIENETDCQNLQSFRRVAGPPGCGKSHSIAKSVLSQLEKYESNQILVTSFTKAAAIEISHRIKQAGADLEPANVGTLHAICYRILNNPKIAEGQVSEWNEKNPGMALSAGGAVDIDEPDTEQVYGSDGDERYNQIQVLRARQAPLDLWPIHLRGFYEEWKLWKNSRGYLDFTDLIEICLRDYSEMPGNIRRGYFDEAQDFAPLELDLIKKWGAKMDECVIIGDSNQSIYSFKGCDPKAFLFDLPEECQHVLKQSYRVPKAVVDVSKEWITRGGAAKYFDYFPRKNEQGEEAEGEVIRSMISLRDHEQLIRAIEEEIDKDRSVMILASCGYMLTGICKSLKEAGLPFHNPYRIKRGDWNPMRGVETLKAFLRPDARTFGTNANQWTYEEAAKWFKVLEADTCLIRGGKKKLEEYENYDGTLWLEIAELFEEGKFLEMAKLFDVGTREACKWLFDHSLDTKKKSLRYPIAICDKHGDGKKLIERPKICVGTVHSVKGGESSTVFLFPDLSPNGAVNWEKADGTEERESIRRMVYVGMTRAREKLYLCSAGYGRGVW